MSLQLLYFNRNTLPTILAGRLIKQVISYPQPPENQALRLQVNAILDILVNGINCNISFLVVHDFVSAPRSMHFHAVYSGWGVLTGLLSTLTATGDLGSAWLLHGPVSNRSAFPGDGLILTSRHPLAGTP